MLFLHISTYRTSLASKAQAGGTSMTANEQAMASDITAGTDGHHFF